MRDRTALESTASETRWTWRLAEIAAVAILYYAAARLGLLLQLKGTNASPVWPPSGIGLAAVLILGWRVWPGIALGAFLANLLTLPMTPYGVLAASAIGIGNTLEQVIGLLLIRRLSPASSSPFEQARDVIWFLVAAGISCAVASTIGVTSLRLLGILPEEIYGQAWLTWWLGDTAGMLVVTPALYSWWRQPRLRLSPGRALELAALANAAVLTTELLFGGWIAVPIAALPFMFVVPWLLWAAFRFGPREASSLSVLISVLAIGHTWRTMSMAGPPVYQEIVGREITAPFLSPALSANDSLLMLQFFICSMVMTAILLAAAVNERRLAEQSLSESERRFRTIFEQAAIGAALIETATGRFVRINQRYCELVGYSAEEMTNTSFHDITHPDDLPADVGQMRRLVAGEIHDFTMEKRYYRKDGSVVWVNLTVSANWRPGEKPEHHIAIVEDISERKWTEDALRESERRFRTIFEQAAVGVALIETSSGRFVRVNQRYCQMLGYREVELISMTFMEISHQDDLSPDLDNMRRLVAGEIGSFTIEKRLLRKDGVAVWINLTVSPTWQAGEPAIHHVAIVEDITERKRAEAALRESEELLRLAQHAGHIGAFEWNVQTAVNTWTPELEIMHGLAPGDFGKTQSSWEQLIHPDDRAAAKGCVEQAFITGLATEGEWRVVWPDRSVHWIAGRFQVFNDESGKQLRLSGVNIDITERKRHEEQLKSTLDQLHGLTAHLESVREEERTRIARELHDELGQSLTGLKLELAWMKGRLAKENDRQRLAVLVDKTDEMSGLIDCTIQAMRRIVTELRPGILDEFGIAAALEWQGQEFQKRTGIRCTVAATDVSLPRDGCSALFRIVQEALTNVARHAGASAVNISLDEQADGITLVIADNGQGISRIGSTSPTSFGLLGMRERSAAAGGTFQVFSNREEGTRIVVHIPPAPSLQPPDAFVRPYLVQPSLVQPSLAKAAT